jgi:hypothetical protein
MLPPPPDRSDQTLFRLTKEHRVMTMNDTLTTGVVMPGIAEPLRLQIRQRKLLPNRQGRRAA